MKWFEDKWLIVLIIVTFLMAVISVVSVTQLFLGYTSNHSQAVYTQRQCQEETPFTIHSNKGMQKTIDGKELQG